MKHLSVQSIRFYLCALVLLLSQQGCQAPDPMLSVKMSPFEKTCQLDAEDIVTLMQYGGFSKDQTVELGTDLRNGLALAGMVHLLSDEKIEAVFMVGQDIVFVNSSNTGLGIYDPVSKTYRSGWQPHAQDRLENRPGNSHSVENVYALHP